MEEKRVADYFVVAGLPDKDPQLLEDPSSASQDAKEVGAFLPITDVTVIIRSQGEMVPMGYQCIEVTPLGFPADLNHGGLRTPSVYLCYRRGRDKPPLVDIGVLCEAKERVMADSQIVETTPYGRPANINNSGSRLFLTYRRSTETAPCNKLVVTDICVILTNKGESPPHAFNKIDKNLNKGMVGSDVFLCYKKSMNRPDSICYKPAILGRFPLEDYDNFPLPESVSLFCLPMGANVESWPKKAEQPYPVFSTFVLTTYAAEKVYGSAITFYEKYPKSKLSSAQKQELFKHSASDEKSGKEDSRSVHVNKSICLLSRWPFFDTFEKFLRYLQKMSRTGPHRLPIERYVSHFMLDVPFPSPQRPRILVQLTDETISLTQPQDTLLPLSGASFTQLLRNLRADNCLMVLLFAMTEQKMLFHSLRPDVLTSVAEAVVMLMFPFHWQCPYIPLCPLGLSDVLSAPLPYLVGVDSRYFDLYDPPSDVICIDLDTNNIYIPLNKKWLNTKILPKRPARVLRNSLQNLYEKLRKTMASLHIVAKNTKVPEMAPFDLDFRNKMKQRELDLEIQESFLRFMAAILKDFRSYLLPITTAPKPGITDSSSLFDFKGFLKSRDKAYHPFYMKMMKTQMFTRFIEERSFVSDKDASLAFFDDCTEKVDVGGESADTHLLEFDGSHQTDTTVFIAPPEPPSCIDEDDPPPLYNYERFGTLKLNLYHRHPAPCLLKIGMKRGLHPTPALMPGNSPIGRRTKQEIKSAQKVARKQAETPVMWAKCLLSYTFSLWFIHLPAYVKRSTSKAKALKTAYQVLVKMQSLKLRPQDEVCYRVLMLLCGQYSQPVLAVKVLCEMKQNNVQPNAITYGYYNKAVLESQWPSGDFCASLMWAKLRNVIIGVSKFRHAAQNKCHRSRSLGSELDYDEVVSQTSSMDEERIARRASQREDEQDLDEDEVNGSSVAVGKDNGDFISDLCKVDDQTSSGGQSDGGYSSMVQEDPTNNSNTRLSVDMTSDLLGPPEEDDLLISCQDNPADGIHRSEIQPLVPSRHERPSVVRSLKFAEIDFSDSDAFRSRVGSIVRNSASSLGNLNNLHEGAVNSPAGVLISSHTSLFEDKIHPNITPPNDKEFGSRRRHKSAGDHQSLRLYRSQTVTSTDSGTHNKRSPNKRSPNEDDLPREFFRSNSFGNDAQIIRKLREDKKHDSSKVLTADEDLNGIAIKMSTVAEPLSSGKDAAKSVGSAFGLPSCQEESEADLDDEDLKETLAPPVKMPSISPRPRSPNIPINKNPNSESQISRAKVSEERQSSEGTPTPERRNSSSSREFLPGTPTFSPIQDAMEFFGTGGGLSRMATSLRHSFRWKNNTGEKAKSTSPSNSAKVTRSSTFHGPSDMSARENSLPRNMKINNSIDVADSEYEMENLNKKPISRSSTLPLNDSKSISRVTSNSNNSLSPVRFMSNSASMVGLSRLANAHIVEGIKSAASSMATKINEIKQTISASATPTKGLSVSMSKPADLDNWLLVFEGVDHSSNPANNGQNSTTCSASASRRTSIDYLSRSVRSDDSTLGVMNSLEDPNLIEQMLRESPFQRKASTTLGMHTASVPLFTPAFQEDHEYDSAEKPSSKVAVEISMSTLSRCSGCCSLLYDEEVMEGWSADESNLNTQCTFCKNNFVPLMTIVIRDLRINGSRESLLTPAHSQESVRSLPQMSATPRTPPISLGKPLPLSNINTFDSPVVPISFKVNLRKDAVKGNSLDYGQEAIFEFEDSQFRESGTAPFTSPLYSPLKNDLIDFADPVFGNKPATNEAKSPNVSRPVSSDASYLPKVIICDQSASEKASASFSVPFSHPLSEDAPSEMTDQATAPSDMTDHAIVPPLIFPSTKAFEGMPSMSLLGADISPITLDPISVPYLSPLVLRKEVENILDHEGDDCLTKSDFVDQHPIIYWNLVWYFHRISVPSHLPGLCLRAKTVSKDRPIPDAWAKADSRNVSIHCLWDNVCMHEDMGQPLYLLWSQNENQSALVHALVTENNNISMNTMKQLLMKIQCNDLLLPISTLISERLKRPNTTKPHHGVYRDLLFLCLFALGQNNIDLTAFDREYRKAFDQLTLKQLNSLSTVDRPPTLGAIFCRSHFKDLELKSPP